MVLHALREKTNVVVVARDIYVLVLMVSGAYRGCCARSLALQLKPSVHLSK